MLIIRQHRIYRADIRANRRILYIFGDNLDRKGFGGQAKEMRGEDNSFGIATKRSISHNYPTDYFFDGQEDVMPRLAEEFSRLRALLAKGQYKAAVIPLDGIGTGLSRMPQYAPKALHYINNQLNQLKDIV